MHSIARMHNRWLQVLAMKDAKIATLESNVKRLSSTSVVAGTRSISSDSLPPQQSASADIMPNVLSEEVVRVSPGAYFSLQALWALIDVMCVEVRMHEFCHGSRAFL